MRSPSMTTRKSSPLATAGEEAVQRKDPAQPQIKQINKMNEKAWMYPVRSGFLYDFLKT